MAAILAELLAMEQHFGIEGRHSVAYAVVAWLEPGSPKVF